MPVTTVLYEDNPIRMTVVSEHPASVERVWDAYADLRQIERFWGPEEWPATFTRHDFFVNGRSEYHMTGPQGEVSAGRLTITALERYRMFEAVDGFRGEDGDINPDMPTLRMTYEFVGVPGGTRVTNVNYFNSAEELEEMRAMGMEEGTLSAMSQIDGVVSDNDSFAVDAGTQQQILDDTRVRITRVVKGTVDQVWRAYQEKDRLQRWLLGPDGWTMPVCEVAAVVGDSYRYEWESADGENRFGFEGELLEAVEPYRSVSTERMIGMDGPGTHNALTLSQLTDGTLITTLITYPSVELRDMVLATGMTHGMEASFARMERGALM